MARSAGPSIARVEAVLESLRRGQRQLAHNPRGAIEAAVKQLLTVTIPGPRPRQADPSSDDTSPDDAAHTYRVDDIARAAGTTVRNVRAYQERGLLHPPTRVGRTSVFDDTHLSRLKLITSMLERGYTSAHILEMFTAWEHGKDLADVLGLETALVPPTEGDRPVIMAPAEARELAGGQAVFDSLLDAGLIEAAGDRFRVLRPALVSAFAEIGGIGVPIDSLIELHTSITPLMDQVSELLVSVGVEYLGPMILADQTPSPAQVTDLVGVLTRFRALAMASVTATLASSMDTTIEGLLADYLAQFVRGTEATG